MPRPAPWLQLAFAALLVSSTARAGLPDPIFANGFEAICGIYYADVDGDGFGDDATATNTCGPIEGFVLSSGDCDDNDALTNPFAYEFLDAVDNNCNGDIDETNSCDGATALDTEDPVLAAGAMGLCKLSLGPGDWGLVEAAWAEPDGSAPPVSGNFHIGHGVESAFGTGVQPLEGDRILVLSTGAARQPASPDYSAELNKGYSSGSIEGTLYVPLGCAELNTSSFDGIALEVVLRAPPGTTSFDFQARYYTKDWPSFVCGGFVDRATVQMWPEPQGSSDGVILFDSSLNPMWEGSVESCGCMSGPPCNAGGFVFTCPLGTSALANTGYENHGASGWVQTPIPVSGGQEIILRFSIQDTGDGVLDSSLLLDNFRWMR